MAPVMIEPDPKCAVCGQGGYWVAYDMRAGEDRCVNHTAPRIKLVPLNTAEEK